MPYFSESDRLRFVNDGQRVTAPASGGRGLRCVVVKACGDMAYIKAENPDNTYERWIDVTELYPAIPADYKPGDTYRPDGNVSKS